MDLNAKLAANAVEEQMDGWTNRWMKVRTPISHQLAFKAGVTKIIFLLFLTIYIVNSSTTSLWTSLFPTEGCLVSFHYYYVL